MGEIRRTAGFFRQDSEIHTGWQFELENTDALSEQTINVSADVVIPVEDPYYGYQSGRLKDPCSHIWILGQEFEGLSEAEEQEHRGFWLFAG